MTDNRGRDPIEERDAEIATLRTELEQARAENERLEDSLSALLCDLTGGRLSKTTYDVPTMVREIEAEFERRADEELALLRAQVDGWHPGSAVGAARMMTAESALTEAREQYERAQAANERVWRWFETDAATLRAEVEQAWESSSHWNARAESAEAALASEREAHAGLRARLEALADSWTKGIRIDLAMGTPKADVEPLERLIGHFRAELAAEPAAPVAAEEGGEQETGEYVRLDEYLSTPATAQCSGCGRMTWDTADDDLVCGMPQPDGRRCSGTFIAIPAPSGSDEQGNRPATPDANGVHDTKGGE